jgi:dTDP-4-amino-4,6-dideoxygalactose transaminase
MSEKKIFVTQPDLPDLKEFIPYLEEIWDSKILTNGGPFHEKFEEALCEYLNVENISLFTNGTLALITALQALRITGEVITTPYSFVATAHSLLWNNVKPIFVDIDPISLNLDPRKIESAITPQTTGIMPVHCYGRPCDVNSIQEIADTYNIRVIYDAAHAFGVNYNSESILRNGDISVLSFHATKVFHTFEGGAVVCKDKNLKKRIDRLKNFGFVDETTVIAPGINAKMSEINSAFGLLQLKKIDSLIKKREKIETLYKEHLSDIPGIKILPNLERSTSNYSYFPILVTDEFGISRDSLFQKLRDNNIIARRYFYPLISEFPMYRSLPSASKANLPIANKIANQVICLPMFAELLVNDISRIVKIIQSH